MHIVIEVSGYQQDVALEHDEQPLPGEEVVEYDKPNGRKGRMVHRHFDKATTHTVFMPEPELAQLVEDNRKFRGLSRRATIREELEKATRAHLKQDHWTKITCDDKAIEKHLKRVYIDDKEEAEEEE